MLMLKKMGSELENDSAIVTQTAEVLELSFRKHIETAWPGFSWHHILLHRPKDGESSILPNDRGRLTNR
jgi:hypothetical protein